MPSLILYPIHVTLTLTQTLTLTNPKLSKDSQLCVQGGPEGAGGHHAPGSAAGPDQACQVPDAPLEVVQI